MIDIDGSRGEGGGQIIRTALALSLVTGKKFKIRNIRAGRPGPGLQRQHLASVQAAARVGNARLEGAEMGSKFLCFEPGSVEPGHFTFTIGTAGSTALVLQTVLPALMLAGSPSSLVIEGGTHALKAPPFEFVERSFLPLLTQMGPVVSLKLDRFGFYPHGGGRISAAITPSASLKSIDILDRGDPVSRQARAVVVNLPDQIARREIETLRRLLPDWRADEFKIDTSTNCVAAGNYVSIQLATRRLTEVITAIGRRGLRAEVVAAQAAREIRTYLRSGAAVGVHLQDQLLLPMALAGGGSFTTVEPTLHTTTNIEVIKLFLPVEFTIEPISHTCWRITAGRT